MLLVKFAQAAQSISWIITLGLLATPAQAASLVLENLIFSEVSGDFIITGGETTQDALRIFQDITGPNIDLFMSIEGLERERLRGFRMESVVTNRTDTPWIFFDLELQEQFRVESPEADGLSFAQGFSSVRPISTVFPTVDEVTDVRDFINFTGNVVNPNETVTFRYFILDNSPTDLFFLRQRPNFAPGGVGTVTPLPVASAPSLVAPDPPPSTLPVAEDIPAIPVPKVPPEPVQSPSTAKVPEPGPAVSLLGLITLGWLKRQIS